MITVLSKASEYGLDIKSIDTKNLKESDFHPDPITGEFGKIDDNSFPDWKPKDHPKPPLLDGVWLSDVQPLEVRRIPPDFGI